MGYRRKRELYGGFSSWRQWKAAYARRLADAGVPGIALESLDNWRFFLQEAEPTLMGGPPFSVAELTVEQRNSIRTILESLSEQERAGDLYNGLIRQALATAYPDGISDVGWRQEPKAIEVEINGTTFGGQYEVCQQGPRCTLTVWYLGVARREEIANHGEDYEVLCAEEALKQMIRNANLAD